jgi:hypothetical protein
MKRPFGVVLVDVLFALALGFAIWISERMQPRYAETRPPSR